MLVLALLGLVTMALPSLLPGSPAITVLGPEATQDQIAQFTSMYHLDDNAFTRMGRWLSSAATGDLGTSIITKDSVGSELLERLPVTLELLVASQIIALAIAIPVALRSAWKPGSIFDRVATVFSYVTLSTPGFVLGVLLIYIFAIWLGWLPATGWVGFADDPLGNLRFLILPALTMGLTEAAVYTRTLRSDVMDTLDQTYIHAARSRGMSAGKLLRARALRPSALPLLTMVGIAVGGAFGGAVLVETLYAVPGIGRLVQTAIAGRDFPVIESVVIIAGLAVIVVTMLVDLTYRLIDPRISREL